MADVSVDAFASLPGSGGGGGGGGPVVRTYTNPLLFSFTDVPGNPLVINGVTVNIIDFGNGVGEILIGVGFAANAWGGGQPFGVQSVTFPSDPAFDLCMGSLSVGTLDSNGQVGGLIHGADFFTGANNVSWITLAGFQPAPGNASSWSAQSMFLY